jgi:hypothetical protein
MSKSLKRRYKQRKHEKLLAEEARSPRAPYAHLFRNLRPLTAEDAAALSPTDDAIKRSGPREL